MGVSSVGSGTTFPVNVLVTDPEKSQLKAGLSADVTFRIDSSTNGRRFIVVPPFAVGEDEKGRFVYVISQKEGGAATVHRTPVKTANVLQSGVEISEGLTPGIHIVTAGVSVLRDGMEVKISGD